MDTAQAYFDDPAHYEDIKTLCSFTHPLAGPGRAFSSLRALKSHLQSTQKRSLCEICLEGRKVFLAEQIAYTKPELERHMRQGDVEGPMAESGFKGHPDCRFCKKRYYGENELYHHMVSTHEECFICRRSHPHRHVYYRDYPDLENHFKQQHFPCEDPACQEQKFVVFQTQQELKTHMAREHANSLSKAERKQVLTLPVAFNYRRGGEGDGVPTSSSASNLAAVAASGQRTVVIGGAASVPSQFGQHRRGSRPNLAAIEAQQHAEAMQASQRSAAATAAAAAEPSAQQQVAAPNVASLSLRESEFPSFVAPSAGPAVGGRWAGGASTSSGLTGQDFPALPGQSRAAKKRSGKKKTAAEVLGGGISGSVRVLNSGGSNGPSGSGNGLAQDNFPVLSATPLRRDDLEWQPVQRRGNLPRPPSAQEVAEPQPMPVQPPLVPSARRQKKQPAVPRPDASVGASGSTSTSISAPAAAVEPALNTGSGGISSALRAANKELISKIKTRLGDGDRFAEFRRQSAAWVKGELSSQAYHAAVASLGLASVVPELASTCPDEAKREELLAVHVAAFSDSAPSGASGSWMPPEAAAAGAAHAAGNSSWSCGVCTLVNAPAAVTCEACGHPKPRKDTSSSQWTAGSSASASAASVVARSTPSAAAVVAAAALAAPPPPVPVAGPPSADSFPALPATATSRNGAKSSALSNASGAGPSGSGTSSKKGGKKAKQSLTDFMTNTKVVHPQNVWRNPALKGQWASAGAGKLAGEERAVKDAWEKK